VQSSLAPRYVHCTVYTKGRKCWLPGKDVCTKNKEERGQTSSLLMYSDYQYRGPWGLSSMKKCSQSSVAGFQLGGHILDWLQRRIGRQLIAIQKLKYIFSLCNLKGWFQESS
jgi:hypothetical protein